MERIGGVDVARGVAVLGMMTAHVGVAGPDLWSTNGWLGVADGRSAALFAVLAGVSVALLSGGVRPVSGTPLRRARVRIAVRGLLLLLLGTFLAALGTPVAVILQSYGLLFALALPTLRLPPSSLALLAAAVAVGGPGLALVLTDRLTAAGVPPTGVLDLLVDGHYPAVVWLAYVLAGLAVGRSDLRSTRVRVRLAVTGVVLGVAGYGGGVALTALVTGGPAARLRLLSTEPHADSTFEVTGNIGVALLVVAACLVAADRWPRGVYPLAATGALALTAYSVHLMAIAVLGDDVVREPRVGVHLAFLGTTLVLASLWPALVGGRGPFEQAMHEVSTSAADLVGGREPAPRPGGPDAAPADRYGQTSACSQPSPPRR